MKGLLIKDFYLLARQKLLLGLILALSVFFLLTGFNETQFPFLFVYVVFLGSMLAASTIGFDEQNHSLPYMFTLPITVKSYVLEKFLLTWLVPFLFSLPAVPLMVLKGGLSSDILYVMLLFFIVFVSLQCVLQIPLQLALGYQKSRIVIFILAFAIFAPAFEIMDPMPLSFVAAFPAVLLMVLIISACALLNLGGIVLSIQIMKRKEF